MLKKLLVGILVLSVIGGCNSQTALKYSQGLVKKEQSIMPAMTATEENTKAFFADKQYDSIAVAGEKMEKLVDEKLKEIREEPEPDVKGAAAFKEAFIKYFQFIKSMYTGYKNFGKAATGDARDQELKKIGELADKKASVLRDIQAAQQKFAGDNGFRLETK
ncbi:hypothetical protein BH11BAC4_BH11BAC4_24050 [soil metagenome]